MVTRWPCTALRQLWSESQQTASWPGWQMQILGKQLGAEHPQGLSGLQLPQSHTVHSRIQAADELLDKLPRVGSVSGIFCEIQTPKQEGPVTGRIACR